MKRLSANLSGEQKCFVVAILAPRSPIHWVCEINQPKIGRFGVSQDDVFWLDVLVGVSRCVNRLDCDCRLEKLEHLFSGRKTFEVLGHLFCMYSNLGHFLGDVVCEGIPCSSLFRIVRTSIALGVTLRFLTL